MGLPRRVGLVVVPVVRTLVALVPRALAQAPAVPRTGFERPRVDRIAETAQGRPVHLVRLGSPTPRPMERAARGRVVLFVPTANPDGREANARTNTQGVAINRDHLGMITPEGQAIGRVIRDWRPDVLHDLHEFPPELLAPYDDQQVLYLWPRNLNVDGRVHDLSERLSQGFVGPGARAAGYTTGIYGILTLGGQPIAQLAGDEDERILRNMAGLRHSLGILVETSWSPTTPEEQADVSVFHRRRVASHLQATLDTLRFMRALGGQVARATNQAPTGKAREGREQSVPVYFRGADNRLPGPGEFAYPEALRLPADPGTGRRCREPAGAARQECPAA